MNERTAVSTFLEKSKSRGWVLGLLSIETLLDKLNNPQDKLQVIHITGTNGKGSILAYLTSVLEEAGYKVARYTSPAVESELERYYLDGNISQENYDKYMLKVKAACDQMESEGFDHPTLFEVETAMAFLYFAEMGCDIALIEVGMGGIDDATNVIKNPLMAIFANISLDHTSFLGNTAEEIAKKKSGIIKSGCNIISCVQDDAVVRVLENKASELNCPIAFADLYSCKVIDRAEGYSFVYKDESYQIPLLGEFQIMNACTAIEAVKKLNSLGFKLNDCQLKAGLAKTKWPYRLERISSFPAIYLDGAHNPAAIRQMVKTIQNVFLNRSLTFVISVFKDKSYDEMFSQIVPLADYIICTESNNPRALPANDVYENMKKYLNSKCQLLKINDFTEAAAESIKINSDITICLGSLSYLSDIKKAFKKILDNN